MRKNQILMVFMAAVGLTCVAYRTVTKAYFQNGWGSGSILDYACAISLLLLPFAHFLLFVLWEEADEQWTSFRQERDQRLEQERISRERAETRYAFSQREQSELERTVLARLKGLGPPSDPPKSIH